MRGRCVGAGRGREEGWSAARWGGWRGSNAVAYSRGRFFSSGCLFPFKVAPTVAALSSNSSRRDTDIFSDPRGSERHHKHSTVSEGD